MAVAMDAAGDFAAQSVAYSPLLCRITIFLWTLALNGMGMLDHTAELPVDWCVSEPGGGGQVAVSGQHSVL